MKKSCLIPLLGITLISLVSAYYGSYGSFSFSDLLNEIDSSDMILGAVFIISFSLLYYSLSRVLKDKHDEPNTKIARILALVIALFITWSVNRSGFDVEGIFYSAGISGDLLAIVLPLIILCAFIFMFIKWRGWGLIFMGAFFLLSAFVVYEQGLVILLGLIFIAIGIWVTIKWPKKSKLKKGWHYHH